MQEIQDYIRSERANGHSDDAIRASLKSVGWDDAKINDAFAAAATSAAVQVVSAPSAPGTVVMPAVETPSRMAFLGKYKWPIFTVLILLVLGLGGYKAYSYFFVNGPEKIWSETSKNMLEIDSAKFGFEASYSENVPDDIDKDQLFGLVAPGGEISFGVVGKGSMKVKDKDADYDMTSTLNYKIGSLKVSFDFQSRKVNNFLYYKVEGNPLAGFLAGGNEDDNKSSWLKINLDDKDSEFALLDNQKTKILEAYKKSKLMTPTKLLGSEEVDGVATWHYQAKLDKQELKNYFNELLKIMEEGEDEKVKADDKKILESLVDKIDFKKLELWIGKSDHLVHQALIETSAPSIIKAIMSESSSDAVRDARRIADMRQVMTALEIFYNDNGRYPTATNSKPTPTDGKKGGFNMTFSSYLATFPQAPEKSGKCSESENNYKYEQLEGGKSYRLTSCIGKSSGSYKPGIIEASPSGLKNTKVYEEVTTDPFANIPFSGKVTVKLNLNDFNSNIKIEEPKDAKQIDVESPRAKSRDARRLADVRQTMTALELFYNDNGRYPTATNGEPTSNDGGKDAQYKTYMAEQPKAPTPADGDCTDAQNKYTYKQLKNGNGYELSFCLGGDSGGFSKGVHKATEAGLQ
jgi:hypothetical protein